LCFCGCPIAVAQFNIYLVGTNKPVHARFSFLCSRTFEVSIPLGYHAASLENRFLPFETANLSFCSNLETSVADYSVTRCKIPEEWKPVKGIVYTKGPINGYETIWIYYFIVVINLTTIFGHLLWPSSRKFFRRKYCKTTQTLYNYKIVSLKYVIHNICHNMSQYMSQCVTICHNICHNMSQYVTIYVTIRHNICHNTSQYMSQYMAQYVTIYVTICRNICHNTCHNICHSICHNMSQYMSQYVTICHNICHNIKHK
jgi:hypothetical protein